ncbi:MAG: hypothetical protein L6R40_006143 [Gallowayella cf. fulva]|nr:MAG: hypothetical protein L6R40_006143 [Xanthomendoza cf. fulva]
MDPSYLLYQLLLVSTTPSTSTCFVEQQVGITSLLIEDQGNHCLKVSRKTNVIRNSNLTHGITISSDGGTLYASSVEAVLSWPYNAAKSSATGAGINIIDIKLSSEGDHITRTLLYAKKQKNTLIIKSFPVQKAITTLQNFNTTGKLLGWGLRNSVGIAEHPVTGGLYSVEMGMDMATRDGKTISETNPGDELNYHGIIGKANDLNPGLNHGYPHCYVAWDV